MMPILPFATQAPAPGFSGGAALPLAWFSSSVWLWGALAVLAVWMGIRWLAIWQVRKLLHRPGSLRTVSPMEFPEHEQVLLKLAHEQMTALGFHYWTALRAESTLGPANGSWRLVYAHQSPFAVASVRVSPRDHRFADFEMKIQSWHEPSGRWIETTSLPDLSSLNDPGLEHIVSGHFKDLAAQWTAHQEHLQKEIGEGMSGLVFPNAEAWLRRESEEVESIETLKKAQLIEPGREAGTWRFTWGGARRVAQEVKIVNVTWDVPKPPPWIGTLPVEALIELEMDRWRREEEKKQKAAGSSLLAKLVMLGITMALSAWAFQVNFKEPGQVAGLLVVLLIHELGHLAAMWACGYKHLSILFIPFFGAAAVSLEKGRVSVWKEIIVLLMGPLPGLVVALTGLFFDCWGQEWLRPHLIMAAVLNGFNLLPVLPMDGGHLFRLAMEARWPRLGAFFHTLSTGGLLLMGVLGDQILTYLAVARLLSFRMPWFVADAVATRHRCFKKGLHGEWQPHTPEEAMREGLHAVWTDKKYGKSGTTNRLLVARQIAEQLQTRPAGAAATTVALMACLSVFWAPMAAWFGMDAYYHRQIAAQEAEMRSQGMPVTREEFQEHPRYAHNPELLRRYDAVIHAMRKAMADPDLDLFLTSQQRLLARAQSEPDSTEPPELEGLEADVASAERYHLVTNLTFPEKVPPALTALIADLRQLLEAPALPAPDKADKTAYRDVPLEAGQVLMAGARRHRAAGRFDEWQQDILAVARLSQNAFLSHLPVGSQEKEILAEVEQAYHTAAVRFTPDFLPRLNDILPSHVQRQEQDALDEIEIMCVRRHGQVLGMPFTAVGGPEDRPGLFQLLTDNPFTKHVTLRHLRHSMRLWQAVHSKEQDRWSSYLAETKIENARTLNPLENAGISFFREHLNRPSPDARRRQMLDHLARESAAGVAGLPLPVGMSRESLANGNPVIVWRLPEQKIERRPEDLAIFIEENNNLTAFWRLPSPVQSTATAVQPAVVTPPPQPAEPEPVIRRAEPAKPSPSTP